MPAAFLDKAQANLAVAQYCLASGFFDACANRAYYAAFQAAIAALATQGFRSNKNEHKWVQATFSGELIKRRKVYPSRVSSFLTEMLRVRNDADYSDSPLSAKRAARQLARAVDFLGMIEKELNA